MSFKKWLCIIISLGLMTTHANAEQKPIPDKTTKETTTSEIVAKNNTQETAVNDKEPQSKEKVKIYHVYDDIDLVAKIDFQYEKPKIVIKLVTPYLSSDVGDEENVLAFNQAVADIVNDEADKFKLRVEENAAFQKKLAKKNISNKLFVDFDTAAIDSGKNHIISIRFSIQGTITGMAHPYHHHRVLNFDLDNNTILEMSDLFNTNKNYYTVLSYYANQTLSRRLKDRSMIQRGTAPTAENFQNWNIKPYGLLITFDEAQVAPYTEGDQTVLIPYNKLRDVIAQNSPLAACMKHRRRCLTDNLLTGGFIDEI